MTPSEPWSRRDFVKTAGSAAVAATLFPDRQDHLRGFQLVPRRHPRGRTTSGGGTVCGRTAGRCSCTRGISDNVADGGFSGLALPCTETRLDEGGNFPLHTESSAPET